MGASHRTSTGQPTTMAILAQFITSSFPQLSYMLKGLCHKEGNNLILCQPGQPASRSKYPDPTHLWFSPETHCADTSSLYSKVLANDYKGWDLNKSRQVSSDAATSSRGTDAGVGQGASAKPQGRSWHHRVPGRTRAPVGVRSILFH
jgi:hypothetical protein